MTVVGGDTIVVSVKERNRLEKRFEATVKTSTSSLKMTPYDLSLMPEFTFLPYLHRLIQVIVGGLPHHSDEKPPLRRLNNRVDDVPSIDCKAFITVASLLSINTSLEDKRKGNVA